MTDQHIISDSQRLDFDSFKRRVHVKTGIDLNQYKPQQMHRRLMGMLEHTKISSLAQYGALIESDPTELSKFVDWLTINVSELFRNKEKWDELRESILPGLLRRGGSIRAWSAGCSIGAEAYSLSMVLDDLAPGSLNYLLATDLDRRILEKARHGTFNDAEIRNVPPSYRQKYLVPRMGDFQVVRPLRDRINFRRHNLLSDSFERDFDFIACRNVIIYFTEEAQQKLFKRFVQALKPGGVLFVGGTERIYNYREMGLESRLPFFYERAC